MALDSPINFGAGPFMNISCSIAIVAASCLLAAPSAHAYLDPGTGSLIVQGAIAAVAAVFVAGKLYWARIKSWFKRSSPASENAVASLANDQEAQQQHPNDARRENQEP